MAAHPHFSSPADYVARLKDLEFWRPYADTILARYGLTPSSQDLESGVGGTFPTFLYGKYVVKMFGGWRTWAQSFEAERAAYRLLDTVDVAAPQLIAEGTLFEAGEALTRTQ